MMIRGKTDKKSSLLPSETQQSVSHIVARRVVEESGTALNNETIRICVWLFVRISAHPNWPLLGQRGRKDRPRWRMHFFRRIESVMHLSIRLAIAILPLSNSGGWWTRDEVEPRFELYAFRGMHPNAYLALSECFIINQIDEIQANSLFSQHPI